MGKSIKELCLPYPEHWVLSNVEPATEDIMWIGFKKRRNAGKSNRALKQEGPSIFSNFRVLVSSPEHRGPFLLLAAQQTGGNCNW